MPNQGYQFYECENQECRLRFPGQEGQPRWHRCPVCRSRLHTVAIAHPSQGEGGPEADRDAWQVEAILDNIRSSWNVGSIFRSADGTGIKKLYLCGITPSPDNSKVSKTALGAEIAVPWEKSKNGVVLASQLRSSNYSLWAIEDLPGSQPLFQAEINPADGPIALIVGNEVCGVDPGIIELCDKVISIPMVGRKRSYNVAVAFGIAASFLLYRQSFSQGSLKILPRT